MGKKKPKAKAKKPAKPAKKKAPVRARPKRKPASVPPAKVENVQPIDVGATGER